MKSVQMSLSVNGAGYSGPQVAGQTRGKEDSQVKNGTIFVGNILNREGNPLQMKQEEAKVQAGKILKDQFSRDNKTTDALRELRGKVDELKNETERMNEERKGYVAQREELKELYGITEDSQEEKELRLLKKAEEALKPGSGVELSDEEWKQINQMGPLTEYQERAMTLDELIEDSDTKIEQAKLTIGSVSKSIAQVKIEMLKAHGMDDAFAMIDSIMDSFSSEIIGMSIQEAKESMDKKMEEIRKAAEKAAEKKEEQEKQIEANKAENTEAVKNEELTKEVSQGDLSIDELKKKLDEILDEAELLMEQRKGLLVDTRL